MEDKSSKFGIVDYCVFAAMFIFTIAIGVYTTFKGNKSPEEFLMGNRSLKPLGVAMSLLTSYVSAISFLGYTGEIYAHGMQYSITLLGFALSIIVAIYFVLPILYPLKLTSINEFIELRFKSKRLRTFISFISLVKTLLFMSFSLYAPTIALASLTNLSISFYILSLGIICTVYSAFGGIRAVIWTDTFQLSVMLIGSVLVVAIGCVNSGGLVNILHVSSKGGRLDMFDMRINPFTRMSFFNCLTGAVFAYGIAYCSDQMYFQRVCAVKSIEDARTVLKYNFFGMILLHTLVFAMGLVAYATYFGCDPMALGIIKTKEQIMPYYISDKLSFIPGIPGIFVATLIGGTLSSLSSVINSCAAMIWEDVCLRYSYFKNASSWKAMLTNKLLSLITGSLITGLAVFASYSHSLIDIAGSVTMPFHGSVFGIFLIGYFYPKCNLKGIWSGIILSLVLNLWISIGGMINKGKPEMLPFSAEECENGNFTAIIQSVTNNLTLDVNITKENTYDRSFLMTVYHVTFILYPFIFTMFCIAIAIIVSFLTGNQNVNEVSPKYICPSVRKLYWKEEELEGFFANENKLEIYNVNVDKNEDEEEHIDMIN